MKKTSSLSTSSSLPLPLEPLPNLLIPNPNIDRHLLDGITILQLPHDTEPLGDTHQVAGHRYGMDGKPKLGLLRHIHSRDILKPITDERSERECRFYWKIFAAHGSTDRDRDEVSSSSSSVVALHKLQPLVSPFNGLYHDQVMQVNYMRLGDLAARMRNPSFMDIKIGAITYDPNASEKKREQEKAKYSYATVFGFRILGMRVFNRTTKKYDIYDKDYGLSITPDNVAQALQTFAQNDPSILKQWLPQLNTIQYWFENYNRNQYLFISSSLLFLYDNVVENVDTNISTTSSTIVGGSGSDSNDSNAIVRMIDLAHVFPNDPSASYYTNELDTNYLYGLRQLYHYMVEATEKLKQQKQAK